jgi:exodeoxyribonuclease VII large subunit
MEPRLTVSEATALVKRCIEEGLDPLWIEGELSNFLAHRSGHLYFTLKDERAQLRCVMFRGVAWRLRVTLQDGMQCVAFGRVTVYERGGQYQLVVERLVPIGAGELQLAYAALKERLEREGLFASERKRRLPAYPHTIGLVTSPTGAALRDIERILRRRWPPVRIILRPTLVQGPEAAPEIIRAIEALNQRPDIELLIVGRGGGSIEDLWAFNDEGVARAIAASRLPVISAVGHEIDETIADFVADLRAPTPSAAAELAVPDYRETLRDARTRLDRCRRALERRRRELQLRLRGIERSHALRSPLDRLRQMSQRCDELLARVQLATAQSLRWTRERLKRTLEAVEALRPTAVLGRGYALAFDSRGALVRSVATLRVGDPIEVRVSDGTLQCRVEALRPDPGERSVDLP